MLLALVRELGFRAFIATSQAAASPLKPPKMPCHGGLLETPSLPGGEEQPFPNERALAGLGTQAIPQGDPVAIAARITRYSAIGNFPLFAG